MAVREVHGIRIVFEGVEPAAERIRRLCAERRCRGRAAQVVTINPLMYLWARRNPAVHRALRDAELCVADGIGIAVLAPASRAVRAPGIEVLDAVCRRASAAGETAFLYGGRPGVAERAARTLERGTGIRVLEVRDGYRSQESDVVRAINACSPDYVFVGLSAPHQELWIHRWKDRLDAGVAMGVGGSLDVLSGDLRRAPLVFRRAGLEWYFRFLQEPWRAGRMFQLPLAVAVLLHDAVGSRTRGTERQL